MLEFWEHLVGYLPWRAAAYEFVSPLSVDACASRVRAAVDPPWMIFGAKDVLCWRVGRSFRIRRRVWLHNSFQTCVAVKLVQDQSGTRIVCRPGLEPSTTAFLVVWFGVIGLIAAGEALSFALGQLHLQSADVDFQAFPFGMLLFGAGLVMFGRWLARDERDFLIGFLRSRLDARPGQPPASRLAG